MDEGIEAFGEVKEGTDVRPDAEYSRRILADGQNSTVTPAKVQWPAFRMLPTDREGPVPHGVSCYALGSTSKEAAIEAHNRAESEVKSGKPGLCFTSDTKIQTASNLVNENPLEIIPDDPTQLDDNGLVHHLLRCPETDCENPIDFQAGPTKIQAQNLAFTATLDIPFTPKPKAVD